MDFEKILIRQRILPPPLQSVKVLKRRQTLYLVWSLRGFFLITIKHCCAADVQISWIKEKPAPLTVLKNYITGEIFKATIQEISGVSRTRLKAGHTLMMASV